MRRSTSVLTLLILTMLVGCVSQRRPPYADDPKLLHYKPTLSDSATILAEKQVRRGPVRPPMPTDTRAGEAEATSPGELWKPDEIRPIRGEKAETPKKEPLAEAVLLPPPPPDTEPQMPQAVLLPLPAAPAAPVVMQAAKPLPPPVAVAAIEPSPPPMPAAVVIPDAPAPSSPATTALPSRPRRSVDGDYGHDDDYHWIQGRLERHHRGYYCVRYRDPSEEDPYGGKVRLQDDPRVKAFNDGDIIGVEGGIEQSNNERERFPHYIVRDVWLVRRKSS